MSERPTFRHQPANPKTNKQNANPYKKRPSRLSTKKRKKEEKKKTNPKIQTVYLDQNTVFQALTSTSSLQLHSHTDQNTVFQISKQTKKEIPKGSEKKGFVRLLQQGKLKNLVRLLQKQAIQKIIQKVGMFFSPFFCFLFNYHLDRKSVV